MSITAASEGLLPAFRARTQHHRSLTVLPRFLVVLRRVETFEQVFHFYISFLASAVKRRQSDIDRANHGLGLARAFSQAFLLVEQSRLPVETRVIERSPDFFERQTELSPDEDLLQPEQVIVVVKWYPAAVRVLGTRSPMES
jgi:hypothetical protein